MDKLLSSNGRLRPFPFHYINSLLKPTKDNLRATLTKMSLGTSAPSDQKVFHVLLIGDARVGKTSIAQFLASHYNSVCCQSHRSGDSTCVRVDCHLEKSVVPLTFPLVDTNHGLNYVKDLTQYAAVVLVVNIAESSTYFDLDDWMEDHIDRRVHTVLLVHQFDRVPKSTIVPFRIRRVCDKYGVPWFTSSTVTGQNLVVAMKSIMHAIIQADDQLRDGKLMRAAWQRHPPPQPTLDYKALLPLAEPRRSLKDRLLRRKNKPAPAPEPIILALNRRAFL